jgi:phage FluMu protein Com
MAETEKTPETQTELEKPTEEHEVIRADHKKNLRCIACGRHIADVTTNRAVVQATCGRHDCKKINIFNIDGDEVTSKSFEKSKIVHF